MPVTSGSAGIIAARAAAGFCRGLAKKAAKGDAKGSAPGSKGAPPRATRRLPTRAPGRRRDDPSPAPADALCAAAKPSGSPGGTVTGINFIKGGEDPLIRPDAEYPAWLWGLGNEEAAYPEVRKRFDSGAAMSKLELRKFFTMRRRVEIKERNAESAK